MWILEIKSTSGPTYCTVLSKMSKHETQKVTAKTSPFVWATLTVRWSYLSRMSNCAYCGDQRTLAWITIGTPLLRSEISGNSRRFLIFYTSWLWRDMMEDLECIGREYSGDQSAGGWINLIEFLFRSICQFSTRFATHWSAILERLSICRGKTFQMTQFTPNVHKQQRNEGDYGY